ncbi:glycoside hydrolase family 32 protein [Aestuariimicrobium sp. T2.26MG-19.2B]|uniref:glycoside hydrolase family 32 protein n=1 Tax=Aestuariimicrobium sp. T2.26MG-19.2B TaxID=3040679 RepID=UPI0024776D96|nr:glycoside hydrolase family 32 protein [Aestuariimicrobium sp. T2.26MG-19.2B]CAI9405723.1 Levanase [Aestuariimicrobium sp. T2.26MG-19.2B]
MSENTHDPSSEVEAAQTAQWRPSLHFTARDTWLNDPNGLITHHGVHHLFFQNNPYGREWGNMSWGHATSSDYLSWTEQPVAIVGTPTEGIFSGSVVFDQLNTSGLGTAENPPLVAIHTSAFESDPTWGNQQGQSLAVSLDDGQTWTRFAGNPVLMRGSENFRDPKVFWHTPTQRWVMVAVEAHERQVLVHTSTNLVEWTLASSFGPEGSTFGIWECPDLFEMPVEGTSESRWVMLVSVGDGAPAGGSGMQWFVGDFDGEVFTSQQESRWLDHGPDLYAGVTFSGESETTLIGWMSNWLYARDSPTRPWASAMTLPRRLRLRRDGDELAVAHVPLLPTVAAELQPDPGEALDTADAYRITTGLDDGGALTLRRVGDSGGGEPASSELVIRRPGDRLEIDRSRASVTAVHPEAPIVVPLPRAASATSDPVDLVVIEDHGLVEVFTADGLVSASLQTFPVDGPLRVEATGPVRVEGLSA